MMYSIFYFVLYMSSSGEGFLVNSDDQSTCWDPKGKISRENVNKVPSN